MNRTEFLNFLIKKHNYKSYLEIGVEGATNFNAIKCDLKHGVDPAGATFPMTSDKFFDTYVLRKPKPYQYDLIFVDGLHTFEQSRLDARNSLFALNKGGTLVLHDCLPTSEREQNPTPLHGEPWTGEVWKTFLWLKESFPNLNGYTLDTDHGLGVFHIDNPEISLKDFNNTSIVHSYKDFLLNRDSLMNIKSIADLFRGEVPNAC